MLDKEVNYDVSIPLSMILGSAEDYKKIGVNVKHELILTRARNDLNAIMQEGITVAEKSSFEEYELNIMKIEWLVIHVVASDHKKFSY